MGIVRHIEFILSGDVTCWAQDKEDFEIDTKESIREQVVDYLMTDVADFFNSLEITDIYYTEE